MVQICHWYGPDYPRSFDYRGMRGYGDFIWEFIAYDNAIYFVKRDIESDKLAILNIYRYADNPTVDHVYNDEFYWFTACDDKLLLISELNGQQVRWIEIDPTTGATGEIITSELIEGSSPFGNWWNTYCWYPWCNNSNDIYGWHSYQVAEILTYYEMISFDIETGLLSGSESVTKFSDGEMNYWADGCFCGGTDYCLCIDAGAIKKGGDYVYIPPVGHSDDDVIALIGGNQEDTRLWVLDYYNRYRIFYPQTGTLSGVMTI